MNGRLIAIDAHPLAYRAFFQPAYAPLKTSKGVSSGVFYGFLTSVLALQRRFVGSYFVFAFDSGKSWRNDIVSNYKHYGERARPIDFFSQLEHAKLFLTAVGYPVLAVSKLEADDILSVICSEWCSFFSRTAIIVSSDRDFFQLVSDQILVYDDRQKKFFGPAEVRVSMGVVPEHFLAYKCLLGDVSDNLFGVASYGKVRAAKAAPSIFPLSEQLSDEDAVIFLRNMELMTLPRRCLDLRISRRAQAVFEKTITALFERWTQNKHVQLDPILAKKLLDMYECVSLNVLDFLRV